MLCFLDVQILGNIYKEKKRPQQTRSLELFPSSLLKPLIFNFLIYVFI